MSLDDALTRIYFLFAVPLVALLVLKGVARQLPIFTVFLGFDLGSNILMYAVGLELGFSICIAASSCVVALSIFCSICGFSASWGEDFCASIGSRGREPRWQFYSSACSL